jgi:hypothetical protein
MVLVTEKCPGALGALGGPTADRADVGARAEGDLAAWRVSAEIEPEAACIWPQVPEEVCGRYVKQRPIGILGKPGEKGDCEPVGESFNKGVLDVGGAAPKERGGGEHH